MIWFQQFIANTLYKSVFESSIFYSALAAKPKPFPNLSFVCLIYIKLELFLVSTMQFFK